MWDFYINFLLKKEEEYKYHWLNYKFTNDAIMIYLSIDKTSTQVNWHSTESTLIDNHKSSI